MVRDPAKVKLEIEILEHLTRLNPHENIIEMCNSFDDRGLNQFIVFEYCPVSCWNPLRIRYGYRHEHP